MTRSSSSEPTKTGKRKATRSVSSLTPSQLARKRANDRDAQRAIRQRTKEHIEDLEKQVEVLKSKSHSEMVNGLMRENKKLNEQLSQCRNEIRRITSCNSGPYVHAPPHPSEALPGGPDMPSPVAGFRRLSPSGQHSMPVSDYRNTYIPTPEPSIVDSWPNVGVSCSVASNVSSPTSTANDEYGGYMPPNNVTPPFNTAGMPPTSVPMIKRDVGDFDDMEAAAAVAAANHGQAFHRQPTPHHGVPGYISTPAPWGNYPMYTTQ